MAVDQGVLVKTGLDVLVSRRQCDRRNGPLTGQFHEAVKKEPILDLNEQEQSVRSVLAKMESGFIHQLRGIST